VNPLVPILGNNKAENFLALSLCVQTIVDVFLQLLLTYSSPHLDNFTTFIYDSLHIPHPTPMAQQPLVGQDLLVTEA